MFLVWTTKDLGDGGRSEKKRRYAVNSKQKLTKNLYLAGSFLTCWLAGPFCQNLLLSTNDFEDGGKINRILAGKCLGGQDFFEVDRECFPCINQRFGWWGQVREEEALCCQFKAKIDSKLVFSWFLPDVLTGWPILPKSTPINQWFEGSC